MLERLGDPAEELERYDERWAKNLERAKPSESKEATQRTKLRALTNELAEGLAELSGDRREELAEALLDLDRDCVPAQEALGRILHQGRWIERDERDAIQREARVTEWVQASHRLEFEMERDENDHLAVRELFGGPIPRVRHGIRIGCCVFHYQMSGADEWNNRIP